MSGYYNINDILMEEEPMSVVFQVGANGAGLLDPGSETNNVEKGAKVDIPYWLAHELYLRQAVSINVPACFNQKTRKEIQADAACVDLRIRCPYFYELGCKTIPLVADKSFGPFLLHAFSSRYKEVLSKSHSTPSTTASKFLPRLTKEETQQISSGPQGVTPDGLGRAFLATEDGFISLVSNLWGTRPDLATTGTCCLVGVIDQGTLHVANAGDSCIVLGKKAGNTGRIAAIQLSVEHNANSEVVRQELKI